MALNIVTPYARMLDVASCEEGIVLLRKIEWIGRISHRSEGAQTDDSWERFLRSVVLGHGDWSITEHASVTVDVMVDRGITHEWVRHRIGAYTQESTRFSNLEKKHLLRFVLPPIVDKDAVGLHEAWREAIAKCEYIYQELLRFGETPQIARSVLPNALASRLIVTYNLRSWRHFFLMRTTKEAHPQMREITIPLLTEFQEKIPILFEDIEPLTKQADNLRKMR